MAESWQGKDSLRQMTQKFNDAIEEINQFVEVFNSSISNISELSAEDIGLGEVDNTSDMDKPVSVLQLQAINNLKIEIEKEMLASQKVGETVGELKEPEVSDTVKKYVDAKFNEVFQLGSKMKNKLIENLTAVGVECSNENSWETLVNLVLEVPKS